MDLTMRNEYLKTIQPRYLKASKEEKGKILDEFCQNTRQNRKYVIRKLSPRASLKSGLKKAREKVYDHQAIAKLAEVWEIMDYPCGQRLEAVLPEMVDKLSACGEFQASDEIVEKLKKISPATIDRRLAQQKEYLHRKKFATTKPGTLLKAQIPIRLTEWDLSKIGFCEIDLVAHCGDNVFGDFLNTLNLTEISTGWSEQAAILGKSQRNTFSGLMALKQRLPFKLLGLDSDNGSEFINAHLLSYCQKERIEFTRSRPNKKNDNAYVEQKNWTHVRKLIGYQRLDNPSQLKALDNLYANELRFYKNFFCPTMKLIKKERIGSKIVKKYEKAKTPYRRLVESDQTSPEVKAQLKNTYNQLNPAALKRNIDLKLKQIKSNNFTNLKSNLKIEPATVTNYVIERIPARLPF